VTNRSRQAQALGRELSARTGASVEIRYRGPGEWFAEWESGPSVVTMGDVITQQLGTGRYPGLQEETIGYSRHCPPAAWAARAIAARRDGSLTGAVAEGAAYRRDFGITHSQRSPEYLALVEHVSILLLDADWPDRPSDPADEPVIERLMIASRGSESRMAELLLAEDPYVLTGDDYPPGVVPLRRLR
jgi:hypothetical protein